eukprot:scaffold4990_cov176-Amphora_coffeaeformis.AAC.3
MVSERRASMSRGEVERKGSMRDLWVIFEIPAEECSDRGDLSDADFISMLTHSQSDFSLSSMLDGPRTTREPKLSSTCKRVDITSPLHRLNSCGDSGGTWSSDENDSISAQSIESTICYFAGDRWSPLEAPRTTLLPTSNTCNAVNVSPPRSDQNPRCPQRKAVCPQISKSDYGPRLANRSVGFPLTSKSDYIPRQPLRSCEDVVEQRPLYLPRRREETSDSFYPLIKTDSIPRFPRRMDTISYPLAFSP